MTSIRSKKIDEILAIGKDLRSIGVNNWALTFDQAIHVINLFKIAGIAILGGDVCESINGTIQYNYDNWYCDKEIDEDQNSYVARSLFKAQEYILTYKKNDVKELYFAFIPE